MQSQSFSDLGLSSVVLAAVNRQGYSIPTEIQLEAIPPMMAGSDLLGTAQTGTGKSAAFLLPVIDNLYRNGKSGSDTLSSRRGIQVLILAPTRELAAQIRESAEVYSAGTGIRTTAVFGGVPKPRQIRELQRKPQILVATPGRLLDFISERAIHLDTVTTLILDEGDRMLDMGFIPDVRRIVALLPKQRQTALFSATMPKPVEELSREILSSPVRVAAGPQEITVSRIDQEVLHLPQAEKGNMLIDLIRDRGMFKAIVFTRTKHRASRLAKQLMKVGIKSDAIHGDKSQNARIRALEGFQRGTVQVLVATDVASRGLDVDDITHVINFEIPNEPESYVHRIGRTARAGAGGNAISLCDPAELSSLRAIEKLQQQSITVNRDHEYHIEPPEPRQRTRNGGGSRPGGDNRQRRRRSGGSRNGSSRQPARQR